MTALYISDTNCSRPHITHSQFCTDKQPLLHSKIKQRWLVSCSTLFEGETSGIVFCSCDKFSHNWQLVSGSLLWVWHQFHSPTRSKESQSSWCFTGSTRLIAADDSLQSCLFDWLHSCNWGGVNKKIKMSIKSWQNSSSFWRIGWPNASYQTLHTHIAGILLFLNFG